MGRLALAFRLQHSAFYNSSLYNFSIVNYRECLTKQLDFCIESNMSKIASLLKKIAELDQITQRKISCMVGAAVGDACCVRLEWIYSQEMMARIIGKEDPVFWKDSHSPYYILPNGKISGYGDQAIQTLQSMADNDGVFDEKKLLDHYCNYFGDPKSEYQRALKTRGDWKKSTAALPVEGLWLQKAVIKMMENYKNGVWPTGTKDAYEHDGLVAFIPLIIQQSPNIDPKKLESAIKLSTQFPFSIGHHLVEAEIISEFIKGSGENSIKIVKGKFPDSKVCQEIRAVEKALAEGNDPKILVRVCGMACELPGSFMGSLVWIIRAKSYEEGIRENIRSAGALCARSNFIGACLGAKFGIENIPIEWIERIEGMETIIENSIKCFAENN